MREADSLFEKLRDALPAVARLPEDCWIVGGSVRDAILERGPKDVDCAAPSAEGAATAFASATRGRLVCLARSPLETWRVVLNGLDWDFTDIDGGSIEADLGRRDFTIGAIALSVREPHVVLDPFSGRRDLDSRIVRMISSQNLVDDPVRMIRAIRLAGRLGFDVEPETSAFIVGKADLLRQSPAERVTNEMDAILSSRDPRRPLELLVRHALDRQVLPFSLDEDAMRRCAAIFSPDLVTRYAALFVGHAECVDSHAERARWSRDRRRDVVSLLAFLVDARGGASDEQRTLPLLVHDHGARTARRAADLLAAVGCVDLAKRLSTLVRDRGAALEDMRPLLNGDDVKVELGLGDGPELGSVLRSLVEAQINGTVRTREQAREFVRRFGSRVE